MHKVSEKLVIAKARLKEDDKKKVATVAVYKVDAGGVTTYYGPKFREAEDAFNETGRKDKLMWKLQNGLAHRVK